LVSDSDIMINNALKSAIETGYVNNFDKVVIVAGVPISSPIMLNMIKVHQICNILGKGSRGFGDIASGKIVKCKDISEAALNIKGDGSEILITKFIDINFKPLLKGLAGIILEEFSSLNWDDIKKENPNLVYVSGVKNALSYLEDGLIVSLNGEEKLIYEGVIGAKK
nr:pyruvate kinase alpha/beta domain-containing protein [Spirochaetota bacterium]